MILYCSDCGYKNEYSGAIKPKRCFSCDQLFEKALASLVKKPKVKELVEETEDELSLAFNLNPNSIKISVDQKIKFEQINGNKSEVGRNSNNVPNEDVANLLNKIAAK